MEEELEKARDIIRDLENEIENLKEEIEELRKSGIQKVAELSERLKK